MSQLIIHSHPSQILTNDWTSSKMITLIHRNLRRIRFLSINHEWRANQPNWSIQTMIAHHKMWSAHLSNQHLLGDNQPLHKWWLPWAAYLSTSQVTMMPWSELSCLRLMMIQKMKLLMQVLITYSNRYQTRMGHRSKLSWEESVTSSHQLSDQSKRVNQILY